MRAATYGPIARLRCLLAEWGAMLRCKHKPGWLVDYPEDGLRVCKLCGRAWKVRKTKRETA